MPTIQEMEIRERPPRVQSFTTSTTSRLIDDDSLRVVRANLDRYLAKGRDLVVTQAVPSSYSADVVEDLTALVAHMAEGYRELASLDLEMAEADLPATYEVLPPE
jgi:hypothetical protein